MLNSNTNFDAASKSTLNALTKKVDALMQTVAGYSTLIKSQSGKFEALEADKVTSPVVDGTQVLGSVGKFDTVNTGTLQAGTTSLGDTIVKTLKIGSGTASMEVDDATIETATINDLEVKNSLKLDVPVLERLELEEDVQAVDGNFTNVSIKSVGTFLKALDSTLKSSLNIGSGFENMKFDTDNRPTWNGQNIATLADVAGLNFVGVYDTVADLPEGTKGDVAYVKGGIIAIYDTEWVTDELAVLSAYRTSADQDKIDYNLQTQITAITTDVDTKVEAVQKNVDDLKTQVEDDEVANAAKHKEIEDRLTDDETETSAVSDRVTAIENDYVKNAPKDGELYGMKDGLWANVNDNSAFVPKVFKDNDNVAVNTITSNENGVDIDTTKTFTITTPTEKTETTKEAVNVEYVRKNLALSKSSGSEADTQIFFDSLYKPDVWSVAAATQYLGGWILNTPIYGSDGYNVALDTCVKLQDYVVSFTTSDAHASVAEIAYCNPVAFDAEGNFYKIDARIASGLYYHPTYQNPWVIGHFHKDIYEEYPDYANYWYLMNNAINKIEIFDGVKSIGVIDCGTTWSTDMYTTSEYNQLTAVPLEGKPAILIYRNLSQIGYIIGYDDEGNVDPTAINRITLPGWPGCNRVYGGKDYWWGLNQLAGSKNLVMRIGSDGLSTANIIQNSDGHVASASSTYDNTLGAQVLDSGDVVIGINTMVDSATAYTTAFLICHNTTEELIPFDFITTSVLWANDTTYTYAPKTFRAFFEAGNYIYFIPSVAYPIYQSSTTTINHVTTTLTSLTLDCINQYCVINKTSKSVTYAVYPWAQTAASSQELRWFKTKDDYTWILPPQNLLQDKCMVISPTGQAQSVALGTGSTYSFSAGVVSCKWSGDSRYPDQYWSNRAAVNEDGIGCVVDRTGSAIAIFYGNNNYAVFEYGTPAVPTTADTRRKLVFSTSQIGRDLWGADYDYNMGTGIVAIGKSFLICNSYDGTYINYTIVTPKDNPLEEPTIRYCTSYNPGSGANRWTFTPSHWDFYDGQFDYTKQEGLCNNVIPCEFSNGAYAGYFTEKAVASAKDTIYLKDGDYVISHT